MTKSESVLKKTYDPSQVEGRWYDYWIEENYFHADPDSGKEPFTIVIPPPNVTGMLTLGHVLNNTSQDILIRKARMEGKEACWVPGMDHASIATENMVVNMLLEQGIRKADLSREEFLEKAWKWKEKYGGIIINQLKKMGCSCDWERERFTMDEGYSRAVLESFVRLYDKGLIYRGDRLVNWCPVSQTAISDEEVIHREVNGKLWYFKYPVAGLKDKFVTVATTRPETMLGDTAVAIYPRDKRYQWLADKKIELPLVGRMIPVIEDEFVDPEFGTGCVKVTPAHDPNDFAMGEKHGLDFINIMNPDATLNNNVPEKFIGLSREDARELVLQEMKSLGYIEKIEDYTNKIGYSERANVPIEYYLSKQWFLKMKELADPALAAVNDGRIHFHPGHWVKTYNHWMENIKDWCISRQLLWGHQIPVYTCQNKDCREVMVQVEPPMVCKRCQSDEVSRDNDVLDTWFSSWLWPFAIQTWPEASRELEFFYPTRTLVTGPDIIFFWVARMIMSGYEFMDDLPFTDVYFTSILRDENGRKFSKSLGNSPDPLDLFKEFGTDAVRFGIMLMAPQGLDVLFAKSRLDVGRNFMNKLWNAARFVDMNLQKQTGTPAFVPSVPDPDLDLPERWILSRMNQTIVNVNRQLDRFHFNEAAKVIYEFTWSDFCDWYIEIAKTRFRGTDEHRANQARSVAVHVLRTILALLHPYAPFITEELWSYFKRDNDKDLIVSAWPVVDRKWINSEDEDNMIALMNVITAVRTVRSSLNIPPVKVANMVVRTTRDSQGLFGGLESIIKSLANIGKIEVGEDLKKPPHAATAVVEDLEIFVPLEGLIDIKLEHARLDKRRHDLEGLVDGAKAKLENKNFVDRAPGEVVARERQKLLELSNELEKLKSNLEMLL